MSEFNQKVEEHFSTLDLYSNAITRVHGDNHPEAFEVRALFESIKDKVEKSDSNKPDVNEEFIALRKVTNNYEIPSDVCETYEATYKMLEEMDEAYQA